MYKFIIHPTDLRQNHYDMGKQAAELAKLFDAKLYLLHVIEPPATLQIAQSLGFAEFDAPVKDDAISVLKTLGDALDIPEDQQFVEVGSVKSHVLDKVNVLSCDLIILGSHTSDHLPSFLGSTAHAVVNHAPCDVLTVRTYPETNKS